MWLLRRLGGALRSATGHGLDLLFPPRCPLCGEEHAAEENPAFCPACTAALPPPGAHPLCPRCAAPLPLADVDRPDCTLCRGERFHFDRVLAVGRYAAQLRQAVLRAKQPAAEAAARGLGRLVAQRVGERVRQLGVECLAPVPVHWFRRAVVGGNAPDVLAVELGRRLELPVLPRMLYCRRRVKRQSGLSPQQRRKNVRGALAVAAGYNLAGSHVGLVDDVLTTGATADEAARALRDAGAQAVTVIVVARGVGQ